MAVQPIDLQTLFTQIDKVGKDQSVHREGAQIQASLQSVRVERLGVERDHSVNEAQGTGQDGAERIKDRRGRQRGGKESPPGSRAGNKQGSLAGEDGEAVIRDPCLGRLLDVSG
jgi:hypothetical protein